MKFQGCAAGARRDIERNKLCICFECDWSLLVASQYNNIQNMLLDITAEKHREKRSNDANRYAWELMTQIANVLGTSKEEVYEQMLKDYGEFEFDQNGSAICFQIAHGVDINLFPGHWMKIRSCANSDQYAKLKGTSQYNTKEMSRFIDGIISEAKELDIETLPPDEVARMKEEWKHEECSAKE